MIEIKLGTYQKPSINVKKFKKILEDSGIPWILLADTSYGSYRIVEIQDCKDIEFLMRLEEVQEIEAREVRMMKIQIFVKVPLSMTCDEQAVDAPISMMRCEQSIKPKFNETINAAWLKRDDLIRDVEAILPKLGWAQFDGYQWFKKQPYTFIDSRLSKDADKITIVSQEFGTFQADVWSPILKVDGLSGILGFFDKVSLYSPSMAKVRDNIEKSVKLDMSLVSVANDGQKIETTVYDHKMKRKVLSSFMLYYGIDGLTAINRCFTDPRYYTEKTPDGSILSFDIQAIYNSGFIKCGKSPNGVKRFWVSTGHGTCFTIYNQDEFFKRFKASFEDEPSFEAAMLKYELN